MIALGTLAVAALLASPSTQDSSDLAAAVADLFAERCASCHSEGSDKPKATRKWADAGDLALTAQNSKLVTAGDPEESDLYLAVDFDDMPPPDSDVAPLSDDEKALIESWIKAGAHVPEPGELEPQGAQLEAAPPAADHSDHRAADAGSAGTDEESTGWMRHPIARWASHHHPIIIHFPIGLLVAALLAEIIAVVFKRPQMRETATFCLVIGALSSLPSAGLGWLLAEQSSHTAGPLTWHRWLGVGTVVLSLFTLWYGHKRPERRLVLLLALGALVSATGHLGGVLAYGADWLDWPTGS